MNTFNFVDYYPENGYPPHDVEWDLPQELLHDKESILRQAGFDPTDNPRVGVIMAWGVHKTRCVIVAPDINFIRGCRYAVSTEPA